MPLVLLCLSTYLSIRRQDNNIQYFIYFTIVSILSYILFPGSFISNFTAVWMTVFVPWIAAFLFCLLTSNVVTRKNEEQNTILDRLASIAFCVLLLYSLLPTWFELVTNPCISYINPTDKPNQCN